MANEPVYVTFEFRGDLDKEVEKVTLGIKGLRDESAKTYQRLIADSGAAYNSMSAESRKMAVSIQENINALRELSIVQKALDSELEAGSITTVQYSKAKAALALQENNLRQAISSGMQVLNEQIVVDQQASDSVAQPTGKVQSDRPYCNRSAMWIGKSNKHRTDFPLTVGRQVRDLTAFRCRFSRWRVNCLRLQWEPICFSSPYRITFRYWRTAYRTPAVNTMR